MRGQAVLRPPSFQGGPVHRLEDPTLPVVAVREALLEPLEGAGVLDAGGLHAGPALPAGECLEDGDLVLRAAAGRVVEAADEPVNAGPLGVLAPVAPERLDVFVELAGVRPAGVVEEEPLAGAQRDLALPVLVHARPR